MAPGTKLYLNWYDFAKQAEHICMGEVVDNESWTGTKYSDMINVRFQAPGIAAPVCHHFTADKLSTDDSNVPHDDCYLVCGKKSRFMEHDVTVRRKKLNPSDAWLQVQQFKQNHWCYIHGHISTDALDEYYRLWHDAIAAKRGFTEITSPYREISTPYSSKPAEAPSKPKRKQLRPQQQVTELSLFD